MIRTVIIEDEQLIAKELEFKILQVDPNIKVIQVLPSLKTANKWFLENAEPDLIFADIQLSDGISFEIFKRYSLKCPIIFTTAYDEYAIQAFKVNGTDYLLKPIDMEELTRAIDKCKVILNSKAEYPMEIGNLLAVLSQRDMLPPKYKETFIVNHRKQWLPVPVGEIACFMRESVNYIYTHSGEKYVLDFVTLEEVEELLDPKIFFRSNRQSIVSISAIATVKPHENQKLTVTLKAPLKIEVDVSREKAPTFKRWLDR
jgi:DNA-binding LytR/AlgR family response regulator